MNKRRKLWKSRFSILLFPSAFRSPGAPAIGASLCPQHSRTVHSSGFCKNRPRFFGKRDSNRRTEFRPLSRAHENKRGTIFSIDCERQPTPLGAEASSRNANAPLGSRRNSSRARARDEGVGRSLRCEGNHVAAREPKGETSGTYFPDTSTVRRLRPLLRRRERTAWPSFVAMRARNP